MPHGNIGARPPPLLSCAPRDGITDNNRVRPSPALRSWGRTFTFFSETTTLGRSRMALSLGYQRSTPVLPYKYTGCANRSCGPPKPGRRLLNGVRWCRWGSAGGPLGPDRAPKGPWGRRGVHRRPAHQSCTDTDSRAICRAPSGPVMPKQGSDRNPWEFDLARRNQTDRDGSLDCPIPVYD